MLAAVVEHFLDHVTEREFDAPFIGLLRKLGFSEIHYLHGQYEFGKDFIAQRSEGGEVVQFVFQLKAGDLNLADWGKGRPQLDILRANTLAHPGFDSTLPRRAVLALTGRLVGGAALEAQNYCGQASRSDVGLDIWDRESLTQNIITALDIGVAGRTDGALFALIGSIDNDSASDPELERFSQRWLSPDVNQWACALEGAIIAELLAQRDRPDQACHVSLGLVRAAWVRGHGRVPPDPGSIALSDLGRLLFRSYAAALWKRGQPSLPDPETLIRNHDEPAGYVTYPVRCMRYIEIISLLSLLPGVEGAEPIPHSDDIPGHIVDCVRRHTGCAHPISDRWAVSVVPTVLMLLSAGEKELTADYLVSITKWLADRYEQQQVGLASVTAEPREEIEYLLARGFPPAQRRPRRSESYVSTVILDLAALFDMRDTYRTARNEFLAVGALSCMLESADDTSQYRADDPSLSFEPNAPYSDERVDDLLALVPHYARQLPDRYLQHIGRSWDHLAVSSLLRDRHFLSAIRASAV